MPLLLLSLLGGLLSSAPAASYNNPSEERVALWSQALLAQAHLPNAAAPLLLLASQLPHQKDLEVPLRAFSSVAKNNRADERVRALARMASAQIEYARGNSRRAQAWLEPMGFLKDFWLLSSFPNEGPGACQQKLGPETLTDLSQSYPGKLREARWRKLHAQPRWGFVDLSSLLPSHREITAFAFSQIEVTQPQTVKFFVGASGPFALFLNGVEILSSQEDNLPRLDKTAVELPLPKGQHQLLLKLCQTDGPPGFFLRTEGANPLPTPLEATALPPPPPPPAKGYSPKKRPNLSEALASSLNNAPPNPYLQMELAVVLDGLKTFPQNQHLPAELAKTAALSAPENFELQLMAAYLAEDINEKYTFLLRAQNLSPNHPWLLLQMALRELEMQRPEKALDILEPLSQRFPQWALAALLKIQAAEPLYGHFHAANQSLLAQKQFPLYAPLASQTAAYAESMGWKEEALHYERLALSLRASDTSTRLRLAAKLSQLGRWEESVRLMEEVLRQEPLKNFVRLNLAQTLAANGKTNRALALLAQARQMAPEESTLPAEEAQVWLGLGNTPKALHALQEAASLAPQKTELLLALQKLKGEQTTSPMPYAVDIAPLAKTTPTVEKEEAVVLAHIQYQRIQASGHASRWVQYAVRLHSERAVEQHRKIPVVYTPGRQALHIVRARILKPDGSVVASTQASETHLNEPWAGMYYDVRARVLEFPQLAKGDVLEFQWRLDDTATDNLLADYWGTVELIASQHRVVQWKFVADLPATRPLFDNADSLPAWVSKRTELKGERRLSFFEAQEVPKVVLEPFMPGLAEVATPLHLSTYATWEEVGDYWWRLVEEQLAPNEALKQTVAQLLKGVDTQNKRKVVEAIYGFVVSKTRYVALEFGIYGFKPYRVSRILSRGFGDCKDKAALMYAMLKEAGIASHFVLLRMRFLGRLPSSPASLAAFNHALLYVPELNLFLDGTAEFHGMSETPPVDTGTHALIVEPHGKSRFLLTPIAEAQSNWVENKQTLSLNAQGDAHTEGAWAAQGPSAADYRRAFGAKAGQEAAFLQQWGQAFPGIVLLALEASEASKREEPFSLKFSAQIPRYAEVTPEGLRFFALGFKQNRSGSLGQLATRHWPLELPELFVNKQEITYVLLPGWQLVGGEWKVEENSPFGRFFMSVVADEGKITVQSHWALTQERVAPENYAAFRAWLLRVEQTQNRKLLIQKGE